MRYWVSFGLFAAIVIAWGVAIAWMFGLNSAAAGILVGLLYTVAVALDVLPPGRRTSDEGDDSAADEIPPFVPGPLSSRDDPGVRDPHRPRPRTVTMSRAQLLDMRPWRLKRLSDAPGRTGKPVSRVSSRAPAAPGPRSTRRVAPLLALAAAVFVVTTVVVGAATLAGGGDGGDTRAVTTDERETPPPPTPPESTNVAGQAAQEPTATPTADIVTPSATPAEETLTAGPTRTATPTRTSTSTTTPTPSRTPTPPARPAVNLSGTYTLVDTVTTGRDSGASFTFQMTFSHSGDTLRAEGDGLAIEGTVQNGTINATYRRGPGTGTFSWYILPDGTLVGWFHDEGSRNSGTSVALRQ